MRDLISVPERRKEDASSGSSRPRSNTICLGSLPDLIRESPNHFYPHRIVKKAKMYNIFFLVQSLRILRKKDCRPANTGILRERLPWMIHGCLVLGKKEAFPAALQTPPVNET